MRAQVMTSAAPVLCSTGGIMMITASMQREYRDSPPYGFTMKHPGPKTARWVCIGAGFVASISGAVLIEISKKEVKKVMGTMNLTGSVSGLGIIYTIPKPGIR